MAILDLIKPFLNQALQSPQAQQAFSETSKFFNGVQAQLDRIEKNQAELLSAAKNAGILTDGK